MTLDDLIEYYVENGIPFTADLVDAKMGYALKADYFSTKPNTHPYVAIEVTPDEF